MSIPVIAVVGLSDSGKTRVATALIRSLAARGYSVAAIKHASHGHQPSPPGKDSERLYSAGAQQVVVSSPGLVTTIVRRDRDATLEEIVATLIPRPDLVIAEGFKGSNAPKILVRGKERSRDSIQNVIALVGEMEMGETVPSYDFQELESLANQIQDQLLNHVQKDSRAGSPRPKEAHPC